MKPTTLRALTMLSLAFPAARLDDETRLEFWASMLDDLDGDALLAAVQRLVQSGRGDFGPTIAAIRAAALGAPAEADVDALAAVAWGRLTDLVRDVGYMGRPDFGGDLVLERAAQMLGSWREFCTCDVTTLPSHRARFVDAYRSARRASDSLAILPDGLRRLVEAQRAEFLGLPEPTANVPTLLTTNTNHDSEDYPR